MNLSGEFVVMEEAQRSQVDQLASSSGSAPAASVIDGSGAGGEEKGDLMSFDGSGVEEEGEAGEGEHKGEKDVVAEAVESETAPVAETTAGGEGAKMESETAPATETAGGGERAKMEEDEENVLDLTSFQLHDLTDVDLPSTLAELDLTCNRLASIDPRIGNLSHLQVLCHQFYEL